jgi:hypothetical protein
VFVRAGHLWVVFAAETNRSEDLTMPAALPHYLGAGERLAASGGTALRFALRRPLAAAAWRDDRTWRVRLSAAAQAPRPLYPLRLASPARLRLAPGESPRLVAVRDPATGDQLTVWPLLQSGLGQPRQSLVEIELLATAQGLAWRLRSDRVQRRMTGDAVEFDAPGGLAVSEPPGTEPSTTARAAENPSASHAAATGGHAPAGPAEPPGESANAAAASRRTPGDMALSGASADAAGSLSTVAEATESSRDGADAEA